MNLTITKVEFGTLMGHDVVHLHYVGDSDEFPDEIKDAAHSLVEEIWPDEKSERWKGVPAGANVCPEQLQESAPSIAVRLSDAVKLGLTVQDQILYLDY